MSLVTAMKQAAIAIVHIVADDLGYNDLGYSNGGRTHTSNIDALATGGIRLEQYYTYKADRGSNTRPSLPALPAPFAAVLSLAFDPRADVFAFACVHHDGEI